MKVMYYIYYIYMCLKKKKSIVKFVSPQKTLDRLCN